MTVINVTNLDVEELTIVDVTMDEAIEMELTVDPEQTFEEAFTNIIEEAGMEEEFEAALEDEGITEEQVMEEEMGTPEVTVEDTPIVEDTPVIEDTPVVEDTPIEETPTVIPNNVRAVRSLVCPK